VVSAGTFAQRMVAAAFPDLTPLHVPHPSFNQWNRVANQNLPDLIDARLRFTRQPWTSFNSLRLSPLADPDQRA